MRRASTILISRSVASTRVIAPAPTVTSDTVAVVGLGKIGLPLAMHYARHGRHVIGCDANSSVVESLNSGRAHLHEEASLETEVAEFVERGRFSATLDTTSAVRLAGTVVVIVPVLVHANYEVDFSAIDAATADVGAGLTPGKLVIFETTLPVGTTAGRLRAILERASGLTAGRDFSLAYSPERVYSGRISRDLDTYPKIVGGIDEASTTAARGFYESVLDTDVCTVASTNDAEFVKLIDSVYRDVNIALANEFARYADQHGLDLASDITASNTQPYSHLHEPGIGVGGHCIPVYPYFLLQNEAHGLELTRRARLINDTMPDYATERLEAAIGALKGKAVLILGIAYRGNVREHAFTSARRLYASLLAHGATVYIDDPLYTEAELQALGYMPFQDQLAPEVAAIVLQANHQAYQTFDFSQFTNCGVVLDGRRALDRQAVEQHGIRYMYVGDGGMAPQ